MDHWTRPARTQAPARNILLRKVLCQRAAEVADDSHFFLQISLAAAD
jgi:hypothetical protein